MNTKALFSTILFVGLILLGLYYCSKKEARSTGKTASSVKEVQQIKKSDIKYYTSNKAGGGTNTYYWNLNATVEGKEYVISRDEIAMSIFKILDFDEDGYEDALILTAPCFTGNACTDSYMFCSYSKDGKFTLSEEFGENAGEPVIEKWKGKNSVKIESQSLMSMEKWTERYVLKNGKAVRVEYEKKVPLKAIVEMKSTDLQNSNSEKGKKLLFDLDGDGTKDVISGQYWDRWNSMIWSIKFANGISYETSEDARRVGVLPSKTNGVHDLVIDFDNVIIWDGKRYKVKKQ